MQLRYLEGLGRPLRDRSVGRPGPIDDFLPFETIVLSGPRHRAEARSNRDLFTERGHHRKICREDSGQPLVVGIQHTTSFIVTVVRIDTNVLATPLYNGLLSPFPRLSAAGRDASLSPRTFHKEEER